MNIKFHNKLEIFVGDRKFVSYNKVLSSIFTKISKLEPYFNYFSLGTGQVDIVDGATKLTSYLCSLAAVTSEISCNPENGNYFIRKSAVIDSNDAAELSFSEIGISATNESNADIFNHILIKDENGDVAVVTKNQGESLEIRLTIFLELSATANGLLTLGDNNLIKLLLGESLGEDNGIYAVRGTNLSANIPIYREYPRNGLKHACELSSEFLSDGSFELNIIAKLGEGETKEIVFVAGEQAVARINTSENVTLSAITGTFTSSKYKTIGIDGEVKSITEVIGVDTSEEVTDVYFKSYAQRFGDVLNIEDISKFSSQSTKYVASDGSMIAFTYQDEVTIYKCENQGLTKIHTGAIAAAGIINIAMCENTVWVFRNVSPYIELYKVISNVCVAQNLIKSNYDASSYSYDWDTGDAIELESGDYLVAVRLRDVGTGLTLLFHQTDDGFNLYQIQQCDLGVVDKIVPLIKTPYGDAKYMMITSHYDNPATSYAMQIMGSEKQAIGNYAQADEMMNGVNLTGHGTWVAIEKDESPYLYGYNITDMQRLSFSISGKCNFSYDATYLIGNNSAGEFVIYNAVDVENLKIIGEDVLEEIGHKNIDSIVMLKSVMIIFTSLEQKPVLVISLDKTSAMIENVPQSYVDYNVTYSVPSYIGGKKYEGVKAVFRLNFAKG